MRLALTGRNLEITPALRQLVTRRLDKLDRLLHDSVISAQVVLQREKFRHKVDVLVHTRGDHVLSGHARDDTWTSAITAAVDKVAQQAATVKGKWQTRKRRAEGIGRRASAEVDGREPGVSEDGADDAMSEGLPGEGPAGEGLPGAPVARARKTALRGTAPPARPRILRIRRTAAKPMNVEDAALRVERAPGSVVVFRDATLDRLQVIVRRADGSLGLIDPEA